MRAMSERVLIIDDDELVRSGLAAYLSRENFLVESAESGEQGLAHLARAPVEIVLCDLALGDLDGIDILRRVKQEWPDTAVVMITGHATIRNALDALRSGASDYIAKPADPEEVAHRLRAVLDTEHLRRSLEVERTRAESRRRETQELLIRNERMASLGILADGAAEDLSNILVPVVAHAMALRETLSPGHPGQELIAAMEEAGQRAAAILEDLKAIGSGSHYEKSKLDLNQVVDAYLKSGECRRLQGEFSKVRVEFRGEAQLPPVVGSSDALVRCVGHLMAHAFESVGNGGRIHISTYSEQLGHAAGRHGAASPGEYAVLALTDSAPPLSAENIERLFEPFYNRKVMGRQLVSGLAMTLVHRVVSDHGGFIDVKAKPGKGNVFLIYFPISTDEEETALLRADYTGNERVLLVDDYEEQRRMASDILRDLGYRVVVAESGREAVRLFEAASRQPGKRIDLAVIDLVLGDEFDGVETYKGLLAVNPGQPAILVSGFADLARIVEARKLGIRQCIQKPFTAETLGAAIRAALGD